jgi:hypothetical protein
MSAYGFDDIRLVIAGGALALAGGVLAGGCSSGPSADYSTQMSFCQALATADCSDAAVRACYGADDSSVGPDTQTCITTRSAPDVCNPAGLPYHATYAQDCVDAHTALYMSTQLDPGAFAAAQQACEGVFNKGLPQGASCTADTDCAVLPAVEQPSPVCIIHAGKGTCQVPSPVGAGAKCVGLADQCPDGYSCQGGSAGSFCVQNPGKGEACAPGIQCGSSANKLRCDPATNLCADPVPDGGSCTDASQCAGSFCVPTSKSGVCSHTYALALGGAACQAFIGQ